MTNELPSVTRFRQYLRIKTVQPDPDYEGAIKFLELQASEIGLEFKVTMVLPGFPVAVLTWHGSDPSLPSILLNSHTDVVPVYPDKWKYDPFAAIKDEKGDIYARGSQDMKCVGSQYLEAIRVMKSTGYKPKRTIHLSYVPDEEVGGYKGMKLFIPMEEFKKLNVGFALDEGLASPSEDFKVYYGERAAWWVQFKATGNPGHGSQFIENTAAEKIAKIINWGLEFRAKEKAKLASNPDFKLGDVTTVNMTVISGGIQYNVVPSDMTIGFDCRITPRDSVKEFVELVNKWASDAGPGVSVEYKQSFSSQTLTPVTDENPWWVIFKKSCQDLGIQTTCEIFPAATDSRYIREIGIPAFGFSPMNNTPVLLHDHNEFLNETIYLRGIEIYTKLLTDLTS